MTRRPTPSAPEPLGPTSTPNLNPNPNLSTQAGKSIAGDLKSVAGRSGVAPSEAPTRATGMGGARRPKGVDPKEVAEKQKAEIEAEAERLALCDYATTQLQIHAAALDELQQAEAEQAEVGRAMRRAAEGQGAAEAEGEAEGGKQVGG